MPAPSFYEYTAAQQARIAAASQGAPTAQEARAAKAAVMADILREAAGRYFETQPDLPAYGQEVRGVDPRGKFSKAELNFAQRMQRVVQTAAQGPQSGRDYLSAVRREMAQGGALENLHPKMQEASRSLRALDYALLLTQDADAKAALEHRRSALLNDPAMRAYDVMLQRTEYAMGLRQTLAPQARMFRFGSAYRAPQAQQAQLQQQPQAQQAQQPQEQPEPIPAPLAPGHSPAPPQPRNPQIYRFTPEDYSRITQASKIVNGVETDVPAKLQEKAAVLRRVAAQRFAGQPELPEDRRDVLGFEDVDPEGKCSRPELQFAQRMQRVQAVFPLCDENAKKYVRLVAQEMGEHGSLSALQAEMHAASKTLREISRAAKMTDEPKVGEVLQAQRQQALQSPAFQNYDVMLQRLEYAVGLRQTLRPEVRSHSFRTAEISGTNGQRDTMQLDPLPPPPLPGRRAPLPAKIAVPFQNQDNILRQQYYSHPQNWTKTTQTALPLDRMAEGLARRMPALDTQLKDAYALARGRDAVTLLYGGQAPNGLDIGKLIYVNGRSISDIVDQRRDAGTLSPADRRNEVLKTLSAALLQRQTIDAFALGPNGKIAQKPVSLTAQGYQPSPLKKVQMNAWERHFFTHYGKYQEKAAAEKDYLQRRAALQEGAQRAHNYNVNAPLRAQALRGYEARAALVTQLHGAMQPRGAHPLPNAADWNANGMSDTRLALAVMLRHNVPLADALDPQKAQTYRERAMQELRDMAQRNDPAERLQLLMEAQDRIVSQIPLDGARFSDTRSMWQATRQEVATELLGSLHTAVENAVDKTMKNPGSPASRNRLRAEAQLRVQVAAQARREGKPFPADFQKIRDNLSLLDGEPGKKVYEAYYAQEKRANYVRNVVQANQLYTKTRNQILAEPPTANPRKNAERMAHLAYEAQTMGPRLDADRRAFNTLDVTQIENHRLQVADVLDSCMKTGKDWENLHEMLQTEKADQLIRAAEGPDGPVPKFDRDEFQKEQQQLEQPQKQAPQKGGPHP